MVKRIGWTIMFIVIISPGLISCLVQNSQLDIKEDVLNYSTSESYKIFLPTITNNPPEYFVSPKGSDTNPGTFSQPWKTIGKAAQVVRAGDTVYIHGGIYHEAISFIASGTESQPIRVIAYPGENPTIDGDFTIPGQWGSLLIIEGDYIYLSGIEVRKSAAMCVVIYGNYDVVDNLYVHHCKENGILITQGHNSTVQNSRVWRSALSNEYEQGNVWSSGMSAARNGVSYATIRNNTVWENWGEGISSFEANQITIEDNISHDNYSANIYISDSTNVLCQRNFVYTDPSSYVYSYSNHHGIMMGDERYSPASANITLINNISYGNGINFYWWQGLKGGGMINVLIANNTFVDSIEQGGVKIIEGSHQNVHFTNNLVQQDGSLPVIITSPNSEVFYSNNLWSKPPVEAASGPGDVVEDPNLAKTGQPYAPEWFKLSDRSPAIDKTQLVPKVVEDYFGNLRGSYHDIGAIEYFPN